MTDHLIAQWEELNLQLEDQGREELKRGISYWVSYAHTLAFLVRENGGDIEAALAKGKRIFLDATFIGKALSEKENDAIPIEWDYPDQIKKISFPCSSKRTRDKTLA